MQIVRRGLLMILIFGLALPAPAAMAAGEPPDDSENLAPPDSLVIPVEELAAETDVAIAAEPAIAESPALPDSPTNDSAADSAPSVQLSLDVPAPPAPASTPVPQVKPEIIIAKVKVGPDAQEFVELYNNGAAEVNLKDWRLQFLSKDFSGSASEQTRILKTFDGVVLKPGEFYAVRHAGNTALAEIPVIFDSNPKNGSIAKDGSVRLVDAASQTVDLLGWGAASQHESAAAKLGKANLLQRCAAAGVVRDSDNNAADFRAGDEFEFGRFIDCAPPESAQPDEPEEPPMPANACLEVKLSEIGANLDDQFIEVYNASGQTIDLNGCKLATSSNKKRYEFGQVELAAGEFLTVNIRDSGLKLGKTSGTVRILDSGGETAVDTVSYEKLSKNMSWSLVDGDWLATYALTPGRGNAMQLWLPCPSGKVRNELTGKCVKESADDELKPCQPWQYRNPETGRCKNYAKSATVKPCKDGQYRSEETGRCRSIASAAAKVLKPCRDDQFRNPETGRCKKIASTEDNALKPCKDGWERNPETNRCRKKKTSSAKLTSYPVEPIDASASAQAVWWAVGGITAAGSGYAGWEWRRELRRSLRRIRLPWQK